MTEKKVESVYEPGNQIGLPKGKPDGLERVPAVTELVAAGLARQVAPGRYCPTPEGHALLGEIMARNGIRWRNHWAASGH